jgi:hypothetical protein
MESYRDTILDGKGVADIRLALGAMLGLSIVLLTFALWRLRRDAPKRTWG